MFYGGPLTVFPLVVHGDQLVDVGFPHPEQAGFRRLLFRKPPAMGCHDHPFRNHGRQFCLVPGTAHPVFYPHPLAVADAVAGSGFRMDLHQRIRINLPQPWDIPMFRMEECRRPPSRGEDQGIIFGQVRPADRWGRDLGIWDVRDILTFGRRIFPALLNRKTTTHGSRRTIQAGNRHILTLANPGRTRRVVLETKNDMIW